MLESIFFYQRLTKEYAPFSESSIGKPMQDAIDELATTSKKILLYQKIPSHDGLSYTVIKNFQNLNSVFEFVNLIKQIYPDYWSVRNSYIVQKGHMLTCESNEKMFPNHITEEYVRRVSIGNLSYVR